MKILDWSQLNDIEREAALKRPASSTAADLRENVRRLIAQVRADGDATLRALTRRFDGCELDELGVSEDEFAAAEARVSPELKRAIEEAYLRIKAFHLAGIPKPYRLETAPGVVCERLIRPIERVGLYVPAGSAPLPSTALMLGVPAQLAGAAKIVLCSPPNSQGEVDSAVLVAAARCGIQRVYKLGGVQAIAAMAYGSESVPKVDKIFGPGNAWVTQAKVEVSLDPDGAAIDLPAGPSEVLIIGDRSADAEFIAADLLSQCEHGPDSQAILITDSRALADAVVAQVDAQLSTLTRREVASKAVAHSRAIVVSSLKTALELSNRYAPEHLILHLNAAREFLPQVRHAGSVFLGPWAPETIGDYCSGTNHVLPTYGYARAYSGVSVMSFLKTMTVQELSPLGLRDIAPCALALAAAEGLDAHAQAVQRRIERLQ
jgi:histidinol dehydrogenase